MTSFWPFRPGASDLAARADLLADRLTPGLKPLARVAYDFAWSWLPDGPRLFEDINPHRWASAGENPVRFLGDLWPSTMEHAEQDEALLARVQALVAAHDAYVTRPDRPRPGVDGPVAFLCAEFGFHVSMPIYSGGLGILAGDILKEASDQALPLLGIGLFYRRGYFRQRLDIHGRQQEYWLVNDPKNLPMARLSEADGSPLVLEIPLYGRPLAFQVWRVDVGRVPLLLLDAELPQNDPLQRWTTTRLYEGNRAVRLAQYGLLGMGGAAVLRALGVDPAVIHLNEGHPALAPLALAADRVARGEPFDAALAAVREKVVFTTHTPVPAGNETYAGGEFLSAFGGLVERLGIDGEAFLSLCRADHDGREGDPGMTPLAIRASRRRNGVSRLHGEVARDIWQGLFPAGTAAVDVPITHVTNGAHLATFTCEPLAALFDRHLGEPWRARPADPASWEGVWAIPDGELWAARGEARRRLIEYVREKSQQDRLLRGEQSDYVLEIAEALDPDSLTLGFARRLATYKRLHLLMHDPERARRILTAGDRPVQLLVAGKAHPNDEGGKDTLQHLYRMKRNDSELARRIVVVEDYDLSVGKHLVSGCDVWLNLPRRPMEASGTSGMKAVFNGALQLSVLDGWWAEAFDGTNGWAIPGDEDSDHGAADGRDAARFYDLLEHEVVPLFYDRAADGVPHRWCAKVKESLITCAPAFSAARMVSDYVERSYAVR